MKGETSGVGEMGKRGRQERGRRADKEWEKGKGAGSQEKEIKQEGKKRISEKQEVRNEENQEKGREVGWKEGKKSKGRKELIHM